MSEYLANLGYAIGPNQRFHPLRASSVTFLISRVVKISFCQKRKILIFEK